MRGSQAQGCMRHMFDQEESLRYQDLQKNGEIKNVDKNEIKPCEQRNHS